MLQFTHYYSPLGKIILQTNRDGLSGVWFATETLISSELGQYTESCSLLTEAAQQLDQYFSGTRTDFTLPLSAQGTSFQQTVWQTLCHIPYGETWSYAQLADAVGQPKAARAVGMANSKNPISIIVPCHRVIGKNGQLTGYSGGIERKAHLLEWEKKNSG